uniref:Uncharacterized protein n=1 Tax=Meloidogyne javanica TaxID=6303 RepID=A0A915N887_MELJA
MFNPSQIQIVKPPNIIRPIHLMVQQQQHKMTSGKTTTPADKHNVMLFLMVNCIQILCVLIVLMQALSTTELRGNFYYADRANIRKMLLESDGLRCKEFVIYNAEPPTPQEKWDEHLSNSGYATLKDREERSEGSKDHPPSSGRILTILERSLKVTGDEVNSTTGELKMRISLLFEWKTGHGQLDVLMPEDAENLTESILRESPDIASLNTSLPNITSTDKGTANTAKIPLPSIASAANSEETEEVEEKGDPANSDNQIQPRFPNGTHAYKINKMEGMQENKPADVFDPFNHVAKHLLVYTLASFLHPILQFCRCALSDNNGRLRADFSGGLNCRLGNYAGIDFLHERELGQFMDVHKFPTGEAQSLHCDGDLFCCAGCPLPVRGSVCMRDDVRRGSDQKCEGGRGEVF